VLSIPLCGPMSRHLPFARRVAFPIHSSADLLLMDFSSFFISENLICLGFRRLVSSVLERCCPAVLLRARFWQGCSDPGLCPFYVIGIFSLAASRCCLYHFLSLIVSDLISRYGHLCDVLYGSCVWGPLSLHLWVCRLHLLPASSLSPSSIFPGGFGEIGFGWLEAGSCFSSSFCCCAFESHIFSFAPSNLRHCSSLEVGFESFINLPCCALM